MAFWGELRRRKVVQVAAVYAVVAWLLTQIVATVEEPLNLPTWFDTTVIALLAVGFPIALILAWAFDLGPRGVRPDSPGESRHPSAGSMTLWFGQVTQVLVLLAVAFLVLDQYLLEDRGVTDANAVRVAMSERPLGSPERFVHPIPEDQSLRTVNTRSIAISPDGRNVVYNTVAGLFLRPMNELEARLIPGAGPSPITPVFSPDGREMAYWDEARAQLMRIAISGGTAVPVADVPLNPYGLSWGSDGTILISQPDGIWRVAGTGGEPRLIIPVEGGQIDGPTMLPDGDTVLFSMIEDPDSGGGEIFAHSLSTSERTQILGGGRSARYLPTGHIVYASGNTLFGVAFDLQELRVSGEPAALVRDMGGASIFPSGSVVSRVWHFDIAEDGTLAYIPAGTVAPDAASRSLVWVDHEGNEEIVNELGPRAYRRLRFSPNGTRVALEIRDRDNLDIWVWDVTRSTLERVTTDPVLDEHPTWMPDGERVLFRSNRDGAEALYVATLGSRDEPELLMTFEDIRDVRPFNFSPDGTQLLFQYTTAETGPSIGLLSLAAEPSWRPIVALSGSEQGSPLISPNGDWFAYTSNDSGDIHVYVEPFPDGGTRTQISISEGFNAVWGPDGDELFHFSGNEESEERIMVRVRLQTEPNLIVEQPQRLFSGEYVFYSWRLWDMAPNGQRFLMIKGNPLSQDPIRRIVIVKNWFAELERLVQSE